MELDKEVKAIYRLQDAAEISERLYKQPLVLTYSGGKDSDVLLFLADAAGIDYEVQHNLTTVDAPETIYHIREVFHKLEDDGIKCTVDIHRHKKSNEVDTMWNIIPKQGIPPTFKYRYCCQRLKETGGKERFVIMGVRKDESTKRSHRNTFEIIDGKKADRYSVMDMDNEETRQVFESCPIKRKRAVNPIIDWTTNQIWNYIQENKIETNQLYKQGFKRIGCIGCPLANRKQRIREFDLYPKYKENYIRAFDKMLEERERRGMKPWHASESTGEAVFDWWVNN